MTPSEQIAALLRVDERIKYYKHCDHDPAKLTDKMLSYNRGIDAALNVVEYSLPTVRQMVKDIQELRKQLEFLDYSNPDVATQEILETTKHYENLTTN